MVKCTFHQGLGGSKVQHAQSVYLCWNISLETETMGFSGTVNKDWVVTSAICKDQEAKCNQPHRYSLFNLIKNYATLP